MTISGSPLRVLIVEDRPADAELILRELRRAGYETEWLRVDTEADFQAQLDRGWQLILADYMLPMFSGLRALELLRGSGLDTPFIVVSGTIGEDAAVEAMRAGAHDYVMKDRLRRLGVAVERELRDAHDRAERRRAIEELQVSERRYSLLAQAVEQAGEAILITDVEARIEFVNPAFEKVSGYSRGELIGQNPRILKSGKQDPEFYRKMWSELGAGRTWHGHVTNRRKDGALYDEEMTISPVRSESDRITHYVAVKRDVTAERALQSQLDQAQKMESVGRLAGGIAHDFNNLLTVINGTCDLVLEAFAEGDALHSDLTQIRLAGERAAALTRQLLAFSRRQVVQRRVVSPGAVVRDMEPMLRRLIGEDVNLRVSARDTPASVRADLGQLEQVLINLVVNARDAMPRGGDLAIEIANVELDAGFATAHGHAVRAGPYVMVAVSDTGTGMDEATRARIFEPFFTTKELGRGTGLGLSTVYGVVKQNEGYIQVYSEIGHGTTFKIYLPLVTAPLEPAPVRTAGTPGGTETILLVEDEQELASLTERFLMRAGYTVLTASSGLEALDILERHPEPVALVITDIVMPVMSGPTLQTECQRLRPGTKVLFMSGYTADIVVRHGVEEGMPFLHKPFSAAELTQAVRRTLDGAVLTDPGR